MENAKKITDDLIYVQFTPVNKSMSGRNVAVVDEKTGEIVRVEAYNNLDITLKGKIDDSKVMLISLELQDMMKKPL
jgi:hypothetical protein